ncbi:hypothetical protein HY572_07090 [Candidatus Micrarchaeota archaeon]|nr:hypothetical protein [Candidatus Micrarchaeota archaeon]
MKSFRYTGLLHRVMREEAHMDADPDLKAHRFREALYGALSAYHHVINALDAKRRAREDRGNPSSEELEEMLELAQRAKVLHEAAVSKLTGGYVYAGAHLTETERLAKRFEQYASTIATPGKKRGVVHWDVKPEVLADFGIDAEALERSIAEESKASKKYARQRLSNLQEVETVAGRLRSMMNVVDGEELETLGHEIRRMEEKLDHLKWVESKDGAHAEEVERRRPYGQVRGVIQQLSTLAKKAQRALLAHGVEGFDPRFERKIVAERSLRLDQEGEEAKA